jgi:hypothetical protein
MGICAPCNLPRCDKDLDLNERSTTNKHLHTSKKTIRSSSQKDKADLKDGNVIIQGEINNSNGPVRWLTYNPKKGKNVAEKIEEGKECSIDKTESNTGKTNFVHYKTTIGVGRSQMIRSVNIDTNSKKVPIITLDPSNLVLENKGKIKDKYKIISTIGRGAFGEVHKIMHLKTNKYYALKTINKVNYEEASDILNEVQILKSLVSLLRASIGSS